MPIHEGLFDEGIFNVRWKDVFLLRITLMSELFFKSFSGQIPDERPEGTADSV